MKPKDTTEKTEAAELSAVLSFLNMTEAEFDFCAEVAVAKIRERRRKGKGGSP